MPPNVASFEKYGGVPVGYHTGQVSEVLTLYNFEIDGNVQIPIQLSYNNNGMKPDEVPTWVGHGWDLMPGGYIVQDIRGIDDLLVLGMSNPATKQLLMDFKLGTMPQMDRYQYIKNAIDGFADTQQDVFSLNFLGNAIKFYFDGPEIKFIRYAPYKIVLTQDKTFEVTDEKGYKYHFGLKTGCSGSGGNNPSESMALGGSTTWALTKITIPDGTQVDFTYQQDAMYGTFSTTKVYTMGVIGADATGCLSGFPVYDLSNSSSGMSQQLLQSINYKGRTVLFNTLNRNDIQTGGSSTAKALSTVQVKNEKNEIVRNISFSYTNTQRLKLDKVSVLENITNAQVQVYSFDYCKYLNEDLTSIPLITSSNRTYAIDHWGYYNGVTSNTFSGVPMANYRSIIPYPNNLSGDNDRSAKGETSQIGMLKKITYPTGGYSEFEYEPNMHDFGSINAVPPFLSKHVVNPSVTIVHDEVVCPGIEGVDGSSSGTFTLSQAMNVNLTWEFRSTPGDDLDFCSLVINRPDGTQINQFGLTQSQSVDYYFGPGTYTYTIEVGCASAQTGNNNITWFTLSQYLPQQSGAVNIEVGGNRLLRIKTYDVASGKTSVRRFEYAQPEFYQIPYYISERDMYTEPPIIPGDPPVTGLCGKQYVIGAYNLIPFEGNTIYYNQVSEFLGENGENGKIVYTYPHQELYASDYTQNPYPEITNLSWRGNDIKKVENFRKDISSYSVQNTNEYTYTDPPSHLNPELMTNGVKFGIKGLVMRGNYQPANYTNYYAQGHIYLPNDRYDKSQIISTEYNNDGGVITTSTNFTYNTDYFLLSKKKEINSKGQNIEQYFWYPGDYNNSVSNIATLKANNIIGIPQKIITANNGNIISGEVYDFDNRGNVTKIYKWEGNSSSPLAAHNPGSLYPTDFNLKLSLVYNINSHVQEFSPANNISTAILWGYNNTYPIAKVQNATYQNLVDILGQTMIGQLSGITPGTDNQVRNVLSQLRTAQTLNGAHVTSYTYNPLIGMTSQTDPNGRTTYYEYDNFGRLNLIRDHDKNILKKICYNIRGQIGSCEAGLVYVKILPENIVYSGKYIYGDVVVRFYQDAACTIPVTVSNLTINFKRDYYHFGQDFHEYEFFSAVCNGTATTIRSQVILQFSDSDTGYMNTYLIEPGTGYQKSTNNPWPEL